MIVGTHTAETADDRINTVLRAAPDLDLSLRVKAERMRNRQFTELGCIEQIVFEVDRDSSVSNLRQLRAERTGRRIYWPERCPVIARSIPEEDLIFTQPIRLPLPKIPDPTHIVSNPYKVDRHGKSHLKDLNKIETPRMMEQSPELIASAKSGRFLVFHPIAQIIVLMAIKGAMQFGSIGDRRMPLSSLSGFDGRKMALLLDPYSGEAYFTGGRYQMPGPEVKS
jgi:hypothetical protein